MPLAAHPGMMNVYWPWDPRIARLNSTPPQATLAEDGGKIAIGGRFWIPDRTQLEGGGPATLYKYITRVGIKLGTVVKTAGSGLKLSIQNMYTGGADANCPRPGGFESAVCNVTNGNSSFVTNGWLRSPLLDVPHQITHTDRVCLVIEWDSSGRQGSDSVGVQMRNIVDELLDTPWVTVYLSGADVWSIQQHWPIIVFELSDNADGSGPVSYGTLDGAWVSNGEGALSFNANSSPDEHGIRFQLPCNVLVDSAIVFADLAGSPGNADFDVVLYEGTSAIDTLNEDSHYVSEARDFKEFVFSGKHTLIAATDYILAVRAKESTNTEVLYNDVFDAAHKQLVADASAQHWVRTDQGIWTVASNTRILFAAINICGWEA